MSLVTITKPSKDPGSNVLVASIPIERLGRNPDGSPVLWEGWTLKEDRGDYVVAYRTVKSKVTAPG